MRLICPQFGNPDVERIFNGILARLGGKVLPADKDMDAYKKSLSPEELGAYHYAYSFWNEHAGDATKIHEFLDKHDALKSSVPVDLIRKLSPNTPKKLVGQIVDGVENIIHPDIAKIGEGYMKMFDAYKAANKDMGVIEKYADLPRSKGKHWPEWKEAFDIHGSARAEGRSELNYKLQSTADKFLQLKDKSSIGKLEKILVEGDRALSKRYADLMRSAKSAKGEGDKQRYQKAAEDLKSLNRYSDEELSRGVKLRDGSTVKLNADEIAAYTSARDALNLTHKHYFDLMEAMELAKYRNQSWYKILESAFATQFEDNDIKNIVGPLKDAGRTSMKPISVNVEAIFNNLSQGIKGITAEEKNNINAVYEKLHGTLTSQIEDLKKAVSEVTGETDDGRLTKTTKDILGAYLRSNPAMKAISDQRKSIGNVLAYFPRVRERGKVKLAVVEDIVKKDKEGNETTQQKKHWEDMYTSKADYAKLIQRIMSDPAVAENGKLKEGLRLEQTATRKTPEFAYGGVSDTNTMKVFNDAIEKLKMPGGEAPAEYWDEMKKPLVEAMANELSSRGWGSHMIRRQAQTVLGYKETGAQQILKNYFSGFSGMVTKQIAAKNYLEFMSKLSQGPDRPALYEDLAKYGRDQLRNDDARDRASSMFKSGAFLWYLGGILRPIVVHSTQNFTIGAPALDQYMRENGIKGKSASLALAKSMKDMFTFKTTGGKSGSLNELENRLQQELYIDGSTRDQYTREILGHLDGQKGQMISNVTRVLSRPFSEMIMLNRQSASLAMFRTAYPEAIKKGLSPEDAYTEAKNSAKEFALDVHFFYGKANYPRLVSGGETSEIAAKTMYTFRTFTHNYVSWLVGQADWRARAMALGYTALWGGMMSLPLVKTALDEIEKRTGFNVRKKVQNSIKGVGGDTLAEFGMYGLPAVAGANLSGTMAIGLPFLGDRPTDSVIGVWGGLAGKAQQAVKSAEMGDWWRAGEDVLPEVLASPMKGIRMVTAPATTGKGVPLYNAQGKPLQMTPGQAIVRAGGMQPTGYAEESAKAKDVQTIEKYFSEQHQNIINEFRVARGKKDPDALKDLMKNVVSYNQSIKSRDVVGLIKPMAISQALNAAKTVPSTKQRAEENYMRRE
jgi:hypothetical protein